jgi:hypothetical protein
MLRIGRYDDELHLPCMAVAIDFDIDEPPVGATRGRAVEITSEFRDVLAEVAQSADVLVDLVEILQSNGWRIAWSDGETPLLVAMPPDRRTIGEVVAELRSYSLGDAPRLKVNLDAIAPDDPRPDHFQIYEDLADDRAAGAERHDRMRADLEGDEPTF